MLYQVSYAGKLRSALNDRIVNLPVLARTLKQSRALCRGAIESLHLHKVSTRQEECPSGEVAGALIYLTQRNITKI